MGYVLDFQEIDQAQVAVVGGKGAVLGELSRIEGIRVPDGFCVTTDAFRRIMTAAVLDERLDRLSRLGPGDRQAISALSAEIRRAVEGIAIPVDLVEAEHVPVDHRNTSKNKTQLFERTGASVSAEA